jgi:hypothetical protein
MKRRFILIIILLALVTTSFAQTIKNNSVYVELLGNGIVYSVNYDRIIQISNHFKLAPRVGITYWPQSESSRYSSFIIPFEVNALWAKRAESKNFAEGGLGLNLIGLKDYYGYDPAKGNLWKNKFARVTTVRLGYRHQKPTGGFMYRAGLLVPIAQDQFSMDRVGDDIFLRIYAGFSLGYTF